MFELVRIGNQSINNFEGLNSESKTIFDEYHSVQLFLNGSGLSHLFRLRYDTSNGPHFLVKQDSSTFRELKTGDLLDMKYNQADSLGEGKIFKTLITSKIPHDQYRGYSIVKLSIIDN